MVRYARVYNRAPKAKETRVNNLTRMLGSVPLARITQHHITTYIHRRRREKAQDATINRDLSVLGHFLKWCVTEQLAEKALPIRQIAVQQWEGPTPTAKAIDSVFAELPETVLPFFTFLRETGCRHGEAIRLQWDQVNIDRREVRLVRTKSGRPRLVPLSDGAIAAIQAMPPSPLCKNVFYNPVTLKAWHSCGSTWQRARRRAKIPWLRIHDLRRVYAIDLAQLGCPMHFLQAVLGHASVKTTETSYAKFSPESAAEAIRLIWSKNGHKVEKSDEKKLVVAG